MINIQHQRKRKSVKLSKDEFALLRKYVRSFNTTIEAAEEIGIHRNVLDMVLLRESASPETIQLIRLKIA